MAYAFEDIKDQVVIITGSGRGIGKATAQIFAEHGAKVVVSDIDDDVCKEAAAEIGKSGAETLAITCDITKADEVAAMFKQVMDKWGKIDCVVNNAGITKDTLFLRMKPEMWQFVIDVNLTGTFTCCKEAIKYMRKARKGTIINLSSIARMGNAGQTNYSAAKAGIVGFTKAMARELAPMGIRVNCIAPGFIVTRLTDAIPEDLAAKMVEMIPMRRKGEPADIAKPILFLASELSSYMTGEVMDVNGGLGGI
jgi:3-oxoacyl-[acyl-carrier protein] reductase